MSTPKVILVSGPSSGFGAMTVRVVYARGKPPAKSELNISVQ